MPDDALTPHEAAGADLLLLHDGDIRRALLDFEGRAFHYDLNTPGIKLILGACGVLAAIAAGVLLWVGIDIISPWHTVTIFCGAAALAGVMWVTRWVRFAQAGFLATDEDFLYVGTNARAWRIRWDLLDAKALGFERMEAESWVGTLEMQVAGQSIDLPLYGPLFHIEDLQPFMLTVLEHLRGEDVAAAFAEEE